jgi:imidazolonepropionase-like amidohydrolase
MLRLVVAVILSAPGAPVAEQAPMSAAAPESEACPAGSTTSRTYAVRMFGNRAGYLTRCERPDGAREERFAYSDRGRGPKTRTVSRRDAGWRTVQLETAGVDYLKNAIEERFAIEGGRARWKNKAEAGDASDAGGAFYVGYSSPPGELADLARALLRAPQRRLPLLPAGEARLEVRSETRVVVGGSARRLVQASITGLGFSPGTVWLEPDGDGFVIAERWLSVAPEGWEGALGTLLAAQEKDEAAARLESARALSRRPAGGLVVRGARLFDPVAGVLREGTTVVVSGSRVAAVGKGAATPAPAGAEVVDARGRVLIPGLWDMHVHVDPATDGPLHLAGGVTSVRDLANDPDALDALRARIDAGEALGPRIHPAGLIDGPGPYQGPTKALAATEAEALDWVRRYGERGYRHVKLYSSLRPELVAPIAREAHARGMRVSGHVPAFMTAEQAVREGYDEIHHLNMLFLNFFDDVRDTRTPARFTAVAERAAGLDLASPPVCALLALLKEKGTTVDPTVAIFEQMFTALPGQVRPGFETVADRLPPLVRRALLDGGLPVPEGRAATYRASFDALLRMVKALHEAGIPIVAGTDDMAGFALHRELELYVRAGLAPAEVLRIATLGAARVAGRGEELGSIERGRLADFVLLDGDPLADISAVRRPSLVVKDGVVYDPAGLLQSVGVRPR